MTPRPHWCRAHHSLEQAAWKLRTHDVGALPVLGHRGEVVGLITDRDLCLAALRWRRPLHELRVAMALRGEPVVVGPDDELLLAIELMGEHRVRRLPVVDGGRRLLGMLALADLARHTASGPASGVDDVGMDDVVLALVEITRPTAGPSADDLLLTTLRAVSRPVRESAAGARRRALVVSDALELPS